MGISYNVSLVWGFEVEDVIDTLASRVVGTTPASWRDGIVDNDGLDDLQLFTHGMAGEDAYLGIEVGAFSFDGDLHSVIDMKTMLPPEPVGVFAKKHGLSPELHLILGVF